MHFSKVTSLQICILTKFSIANHLINNVCQEIKYDELAKLFGGTDLTAKSMWTICVRPFLFNSLSNIHSKAKREYTYIFSHRMASEA